MKLLVCISHVPDTTTKIQFEADGSKLNKSGVTYIINPYCEYGLSKAIDFREAGKSVNITVLCVGGPEVEPTLRKALAIGADAAVRIDAQPTDSSFVAKQIADYAVGKDFAVIFTGKESIDFNGSMVPGMIAEHLDMPFVSYATYMELIGDSGAKLYREVDGGYEVVEAKLPLVVSCQKGISEWRIPNMRGIMAARNKPLAIINANSTAEYTKTVKFDYPPAKESCQYFEPDNASGLVNALVSKGLI
ncbi:MAG: electron transfer flavoprotein subunit beta/FixA family protein [Bacteroidia bacterium]|nr:electron transfer flavoprotein subunit beta/FixA family protein [Bacteroidia bacterium]